MRIRYQGPLSAVEIAATGQVAARGTSVDVDSEVAEALLEQSDTWARVSSSKKKSSKSTPTNDEGDDS